MTAKRVTHEADDFDLLERESGIPPRGKLGASRNELVALVLAAVVFLLIAAAFWWESTR